jgi:hypothetical protein
MVKPEGEIALVKEAGLALYYLKNNFGVIFKAAAGADLLTLMLPWR